ncbi:MAG: sulfur carrier protein ThiS [Limisphaerales bacterium]|nr:MAG: sulfur carrier protein ThiS [Limisphaerales bacterium]
MAIVTANGKETQVTTPCTVEDFLQQLELPPRSVVVELNGEALTPSSFAGKQLQSGDRLEIVRIVAGG